MEAKGENETGLSLGKISSFKFDFSKPEEKAGLAASARAVFRVLNKAHSEGRSISFKDLINEAMTEAKNETENSKTQTQLTDGTNNNPGATRKD